MTEVLHSSNFGSTPRTTNSCPFPSPCPSASLTYAPLHSLTRPNTTSLDADDTHGIALIDGHIGDTLSTSAVSQDGRCTNCETTVELEVEAENRDDRRSDQLSLLALLVTLFRKSVIACLSDRRELCAMEIGWPTDVRHVAHVTFDRFNGFLGLPVELEPEVPRRPPSASTTVFGVSTESMQLSYDSRGNSVPTILLLMQSRLYAQGGLQAEGIFRINAENSHEEYVRDQLNRGEVPEGIDVHCLAGLIKAWFRELPTGVLDSLSPELVMQCQSEEECAELARQLPPTEAALLDWVINLMADVVQYELLNKMNARNVAMVFAPNMTQMADALTALMYAVQVMNFLKTLILRTLRERKDSIIEHCPSSLSFEPSDDSGRHGPLPPCLEDTDNEEYEDDFVADEPIAECPSEGKQLSEVESANTVISSSAEYIPEELLYCEFPPKGNVRKCWTGQSSNSNCKWGSSTKTNRQQPAVQGGTPSGKPKGISNLSRIDSRTELIEAWR